MGSTKHEKSFVDFEQPYERNIIGMKGIVYFGIGLLALIIITFGLMWALLNVFEDGARQTKGSNNPMAMTERDRLPPEPRLQSAPGFGVEGPDGRVNMELHIPQAEYNELRRQWELEWRNGQRDPHTGVTTVMPIDEAKQKFLSGPIKAKTGPEAEQAALLSKMSYSDASSGRKAAIRRR